MTSINSTQYFVRKQINFFERRLLIPKYLRNSEVAGIVPYIEDNLKINSLIRLFFIHSLLFQYSLKQF